MVIIKPQSLRETVIDHKLPDYSSTRSVFTLGKAFSLDFCRNCVSEIPKVATKHVGTRLALSKRRRSPH